MTKSEIIAHFGNGSKAAQALGITRMAVNSWRENAVPMLRQYEIERLTKGALKADV